MKFFPGLSSSGQILLQAAFSLSVGKGQLFVGKALEGNLTHGHQWREEAPHERLAVARGRVAVGLELALSVLTHSCAGCSGSF